MYWTDWGFKNKHIGKAGMDGTNPQILLNASYLFWPNGITISYATNELFWVDGKLDTISKCDLDGNNVKIIINAKGMLAKRATSHTLATSH